jgi:hypothetical protein
LSFWQLRLNDSRHIARRPIVTGSNARPGLLAEAARRGRGAGKRSA